MNSVATLAHIAAAFIIMIGLMVVRNMLKSAREADEQRRRDFEEFMFGQCAKHDGEKKKREHEID